MVGHYRITRKIGAGGMGEVFLAEDTELDRNVALKFLPDQLCQDSECRARFKREVQAAAKLDHPNITIVYEVGEFRGRPFFAMQYVEGESLRSIIKRKIIDINDAIDITIQICRGLQEAHNSGITHRDIKPSNILISGDNAAKIADFGLASVSGGSDLTGSGSILGTIGYMSPEQARGDHVDSRSDIFSLGVALYEMVTRKSPFKGETVAATIDKIIKDHQAPITERRPDVPPGLPYIIDKALEKDADFRYQTVGEMEKALIDLKVADKNRNAQREKLPSIAVLPFVNLSADSEQEYFCDGMAEEIINALVHVENLRVVARTSCFAFKDKQDDIRNIGRKLDVTTLLEGSVRKAGNRLRITAQLINVADGYHLWSERYDRELDDIFEVQDEISIAIVEKLKVKLLGDEHAQIIKRPTDNIKAYNLYLKGRYHWNNRTVKEAQKAIECLEKVVKLDPEFALGYAGLADAYVIQADNMIFPGTREKFLELAEKVVFKALDLDNSLAEAHAALAQIRFAQWNWHEAEKEYKLAIRLNPRYPTAHHWYAIYLAAQGRYVQSREHAMRARELDPLSPPIIGAQAFGWYMAGQYDRAMKVGREGEEINEDYPLYPLVAGWSLLQTGEYDKAINKFQRSIDIIDKEVPGENDPAKWMVYIGIAYAKMGEWGKAKDILEDKIKECEGQDGPYFQIAILCFELGQIDRGFECLERSVENKEFWLPVFRFTPMFDSVRNDPRFVSLMKNTGLDQDIQEVSIE
jgi:serine/threonine protein kinase/Tfp pilus assembly protein PilF